MGIYKNDIEGAREALQEAQDALGAARYAMEQYIAITRDQNFEAYAMQSVTSNGSRYDNGAAALIENRLASLAAFPDADELVRGVAELAKIDGTDSDDLMETVAEALIEYASQLDRDSDDDNSDFGNDLFEAINIDELVREVEAI